MNKNLKVINLNPRLNTCVETVHKNIFGQQKTLSIFDIK